MSSPREVALELLSDFHPRRDRVRDALSSARGRISDARDRALLTELAYGVVRRIGTLDAILRRFVKRPLAHLDAHVHAALRLGLYQLLFLDRVPAHAAVDETVGSMRGRGGKRLAGFVNGVLRSVLRALEGPALGEVQVRRDVPREDGSALRFSRPVFADPARDRASHLGQRFGMPPWLVRRWLSFYGPDRTDDILRASLGRPPLTARARGDRDALIKRLIEVEGIEARHGSVETALVLPGSEAELERYLEAGDLWVQDATSQRVVSAMDLAPQMEVLDLCASPGGKSLHLADVMGKGLVVSCDVSEEKLEPLRQLQGRMGDVQHEVVELPRDEDASVVLDGRSFDRILVDAPCSNTGVLRRRVEARWRLEPRDIEALADLQLDLLEQAWLLLRPGGELTFSTCSIEPEEGEGVVARFVERHPEAERREGFRAFPTSHADGGYCVTLVRP